MEAFGLSPEQLESSTQQTVTCIGIMQGLGAQVGYGSATRRVCRATEQNVTALGCAALTSVAWELLVAALRHLALCSGIFGDVEEVAVEAMADELREVAGSWMARELETQRLNPVGLLIGHSNRVSTAWCHEATSWMSSERTSYSPCRWASTAVRWGLSHCTLRLASGGVEAHGLQCQGLWPCQLDGRGGSWGAETAQVWRDTHFIWLYDSIAAAGGSEWSSRVPGSSGAHHLGLLGSLGRAGRPRRHRA